MSNELKDIANKLCPYDTLDDGWLIVSAAKQPNGHWTLEIVPHKAELKEERESE